MKYSQNAMLLSLGSLSALAAAQPAQEQRQATQSKPNILLILADDMGYSDLGCYGSEIATPNLDRLAGEGVRMTQFYNASRCCPSRASLLTGLYQHQAGVGDMVNNLGTPQYQGYINQNSVTLAEALKSNGYNTYLSGKWHVGEKKEGWPFSRGFDQAFGLIGGASSYYKLAPYRINQASSRMALNDQLWTPPDSGFYMTNAIGDYAVKYLDMEKSKPEPFFMYLAFTAPHWPLHALPEDVAKYKGRFAEGWQKLREKRFQRMKTLGILDEGATFSPVDPESPKWDTLSPADRQMWERRMEVYAAMLDRLDQNVGKVLNKLKEMGELDNTLVIFLSDNGACHEQIKNRGAYIRTTGVTGNPDSFDSYEFPWANLSNTPFRLYKHWEHEGGISTSFIAWYPKCIKPAIIKNFAGHITDVMPTFMDAAHATYPTQYKGNAIQPEEGISLLPLWEGKSVKRNNPLFWEHEGNRAVRDGNWKLVSKYNEEDRKFGAWELYDIAKDRGETIDLSAKNATIVQRLSAAYDAWVKRAGVLSKEEIDSKRPKGGGE